MPTQKEAVREISYASSAKSRGGRVLIRTMENATGRPGLIRRAMNYDREVAMGRDFWDVVTRRYGLSLDVIGGTLENIPETGPVVLVANHPYGILDGLIMGYILSARRNGDFRIIAHRVFRKAQDLDRVILPIAFDETPQALQTNIETRKTALRYLDQGGAIGIFPGGTVSTAPTPFGRPTDPIWRSFTAKMILKSNATVVPLYFDGQNSRLFQMASHIHYTLRMSMLIREFRRRVDTPVRIAVGQPIKRSDIDQFRHDPQGLMHDLRHRTYALAPNHKTTAAYGFEYEDRYRDQARQFSQAR